MGGRIHKHSDFIRRFHKCSPKTRERYLREASAEEVRSLCECALNVYQGNIPVKPKEVVRLKPHKETLKALSFGKGGINKKRNILIQKGGFLPLLAAAVIPLLGNLLFNNSG